MGTTARNATGGFQNLQPPSESSRFNPMRYVPGSGGKLEDGGEEDGSTGGNTAT